MKSKKVTGKDVYLMKWDYRFLFGRHKARRVDEVYDGGNPYGASYLAWVYYNVEDVDFHDDILNALGLSRIGKPGNAPEMYDAYVEALPEEVRDLVKNHGANCRMGAAAHRRREDRVYFERRCARVEFANFRASNKALLQAQNHGHKKLK